jgi:hypothetical protein
MILTRGLLLAGTVLLATGTTGCVAQTRYVEVRDALVREQAGHHETASQLRETGDRLIVVEQERDQARREVGSRQARLDRNEQRLAQLRMDLDVAAQQREEAGRIVEQLRGELARVADHLRTFSDQRDTLRTALDAAEGKLARLAEVEREAAARAVVVRDLAVALHRPVATGEAELALVEGRPVLRLPAARVVPTTDAAGVDPDGDAMLAAVARVAAAHPGVSVHVTEVGIVGASEAPEARLERVSARLVQHGLAQSQVLVEVPPPERSELAKALGEAEPGRIEFQLLVAAGS